MNVKVDLCDLRDAANEAVYLPALIRCARAVAAKTDGAQVGMPHIGGSAQSLYTTALLVNDEIVRNHEDIATGLLKAADSYEDADDRNREDIDKSFRLEDEDVLRKLEER